MPTMDLVDWLDEFTSGNSMWYVKRLSGNDTLANKAHQAGPYFPKDFVFKIFPTLNKPNIKNPDIEFCLSIDSHSDHRSVRAVWYNNKLHGGSRNETRLTRFGGMASAILDPESTGALTVFAFLVNDEGEAENCHVWICRHETEEDLVQDRIGPVEPGKGLVWSPTHLIAPDLFFPIPSSQGSCWLESDEIPVNWLAQFPTGAEIIEKAIEICSFDSLDPDRRLLKRRDCEFDLFRSLEEAVELPAIKQGFNTVQEFVEHGHKILQRRKSRSGRSLELHLHRILSEEGLIEDSDFSHQPESEAGKRPDFLFPSESAYKDGSFPSVKLRMLAVKTTCKDRWRQVINEADRIRWKHLFTLQEGISERQFDEMINAGIRLVIPAPLVSKFPKSIRPNLQTLESFIADVRLLRL